MLRGRFWGVRAGNAPETSFWMKRCWLRKARRILTATPSLRAKTSSLTFFCDDQTDWYHEVCLGANARINALTVWRVFQIAMSGPRLHATSTAKSIADAMTTPQLHLP